MLILEKLRSQSTFPEITLVGLLNGHLNHFEIPIHEKNTECVRLATKLFECATEQGIQAGKYYGPSGADIYQLLRDRRTDCIIEITPGAFENLPRLAAKELFENYVVILSDLWESGSRFAMSTSVVDYFKDKKITPRKVFVIGSDFLMQDCPEFNIFQIRVNMWPYLIFLQDPNVSSFLWDSKARKTAIDQIANPNKHFAICLNCKPRPGRVILLDLLEQKNLLEKIEWSLFYYKSELDGWRNRFFHDYVDHNNLHLVNFLERHNLPRIYGSDHHIVIGGNPFMLPEKDFVGKYHWSIVSETLMNSVKTCFGQFNSISEKAYKAMVSGSIPIVSGAAGIEQQIKSQGFLLPANSYDQLGGVSRIHAIVDHVDHLHKHVEPPTEYAVENFVQITTTQWLLEQLLGNLTVILQR